MPNKTLTKVFKLNDIKTILRVHVNLRIYIQSQEEEKLASHGSHENTIEKENKNSWSQRHFKRSSQDDDSSHVQPSLSFIKDLCCLL